MASGAGRPVSTRPAPPCATRLSRTGRVAGQPGPAPFRGGSTRVDPSRLNGTGQIRPVTNHGTNRVGENFPRPLLFIFLFFKVLYYYICETGKLVLDPYFIFLFFLALNSSKYSQLW